MGRPKKSAEHHKAWEKQYREKTRETKAANRHLYEYRSLNPNKTRDFDHNITMKEIAGKFNDDLELSVVSDLQSRHGDKFSSEDIREVVAELRKENIKGFYSERWVKYAVASSLHKIQCAPNSLKLLRQMIATRNELASMRDRRLKAPLSIQ